jgi:hypothetical protein
MNLRQLTPRGARQLTSKRGRKYRNPLLIFHIDFRAGADPVSTVSLGSRRGGPSPPSTETQDAGTE